MREPTIEFSTHRRRGFRPGPPFKVCVDSACILILGSYTEPCLLGRPYVASIKHAPIDLAERERIIASVLDLLQLRCTTEGENDDQPRS